MLFTKQFQDLNFTMNYYSASPLIYQNIKEHWNFRRSNELLDSKTYHFICYILIRINFLSIIFRQLKIMLIFSLNPSNLSNIIIVSSSWIYVACIPQYRQKYFIQSSLLSRGLPRRPIMSLDYVVDRKRAKFSLSSSSSSSSSPPHHPSYHQPLLIIVIMLSIKGVLRRIKRILAIIPHEIRERNVPKARRAKQRRERMLD